MNPHIKKRIILVAMVVLLVCVMVLGICFVINRVRNYHLINTPAEPLGDISNPANNRQYEASVRMFVWDGNLYFYPYGHHVKAQYYRELCEFSEDTVVSHGKMIMLYAEENGYVYYEGGEHAKYHPGNPLPDEEELMCLNLSDGTRQCLGTINTFSWHYIYFDEEGVCYIPGKRQQEYYPVQNGVMYPLAEHGERYPLGQNQYAIEYHDLVRYDAQGNREVLREFVELGTTCIIPHEGGLIVYNEGACNLLYYIPKDTQELIKLFSVQGFASESAMNMYGEYIYVSFERYKGMGGISLTKFENDTLEGTYRISLTDYSVEKLSDDIYNGLFIFDDTGIYACNEDGCIYKLDFDGQRILTLLEK